MTILEGVLQGILQGLTEFLPVSSSGHLALFQHFFGLSGEDSLLFTVMLHLATLAAVVAAYYRDLGAMVLEFGRMCKDIVTGQFHFKTNNPNRRMILMLAVATLPLVLVVPLRGVVAGITADNDIVLEGIFFLVTSLLLFLASRARPAHAGIEKMHPRQAVTIGVMQGIAVLPGISRSGSTLSTGLILGFNREFMVKFTFLLSIPAILGGAVFEFGDAAAAGFNIAFWPLFFGMLAAAVSGYFCIRLVRYLLLSNRFKIFAWYTLVLGVVVVVVGVVEHLTGGFGQGAGVVSSVSQSVAAGLGQALRGALPA